MTASNSSKQLVAVGHLLAWLSLGAWMFAIYLFLQYDATRPTVPQPVEGRIYESNNHGHVVYLNSREEETLDSLGIGAFVLFGMAALISYHGTHPQRFGEIRNESWAFFCSLSTTAGWSAVGRAIGQEGTSIAQSVRGIFTGPEKVYLRSDYSIDTCRTELQKHVYLNAANICGDVDGNRVHLFMVHKELTNSFSPHYYGKLQARPSGTMVKGRFTMARFVMVFLAVWFVGVGVVTVVVTPSSIETLLSGRPLVLNPLLGALFPPCLLACGFLMLHWGYRLGRSDKVHIIKFLQHTLNARQETSL